MIEELKKIELRKKEREKKTQDLQKLITAADSNIDSRKADKKKTNKKFQQQQKIKDTTAVCLFISFVICVFKRASKTRKHNFNMVTTLGLDSFCLGFI